MKKNAFAAVALAAVLALSPLPTTAQQAPSDAPDMQALRNAVKTDKRAYVAKILDLTPAESKKFWPVYDTFQRHLDAIQNRRARLVEDFVGRDSAVSDRYARVLVNELMSIDEDETKVLRALSKRALKVLPLAKAARYMQIENKVRAAQAYDIAAVLPYVK